MEYQIEAVAPQVNDYTTQYGDFKSYKVKLSGETGPVEISQKSATPAPRKGETVNGTITETQHGKKFKKEYAFTPGVAGAKPSVSKAPFDSFTMYLSYAKDLAVCAVVDGKFDTELYASVLDAVNTGAYVLYDNRPDAPDKPTETKVDDSWITEPTDDFNLQLPPDFLETVDHE